MSTLAVDKATNVAGTAYYDLMDFDTAKSASGTAVDFTGIPSWVKKISVIFDLVSTTGTSQCEIRLGTSGGIVSSGYSSSAQNAGAGNISTAGFVVDGSVSATLNRTGIIHIQNITGNVWVSSGDIVGTPGTVTTTNSSGGRVSLSGTLTQLRITTAGGTDTFDAGTINLLYEGYNV
jgi:hypothetical protein